MDRREFLRLSCAAPLLLQQTAAEAGRTTVVVRPGDASRFPLLEVSGSYREIGYAIGRHFGQRIVELIRRRGDWHRRLLAIAASPHGRERSKQLYRIARREFPEYIDEIRGMAEGAGLDRDTLWVMTIKSELGALVRRQPSTAESPAVASEPENPGCSTLLLDDRRRSWLCHNEDGDRAYSDLMFLVRATPPSGVSFLSLVYPGILTGNGPSINDHGVVQTTNYIGCVRSEVGIPRYLIGRAILEAKSLDEARQIATLGPRAYPYHHNLASVGDGRYLSLETVPDAAEEHEPQGLFVHTNHLLSGTTKGYPYEDCAYRSTSSMSRYAALEHLAGEIPQESLTHDDLLKMLSSHLNAPYSPCRHPDAGVRGTTLATASFDLDRGTFRLYRGNPCTAVPGGRFEELRL